MQEQNSLAINLMNITEPKAYKEFSEGFFTKKPEMSGLYYLFKNINKPKICLIINASSFKYPSNVSKINDYIYLVFNVSSLEEYFENVVDVYIPQIVESLDTFLKKKSTRNLPYGYYMDVDGNVQKDSRAVSEVRRIYNLYLETRSIRHIARKLRTNFSDIRNILHDSEKYLQMQPPIVSPQKLKEVAEIMAQNVRGGATAKRSLKDEIADARRRRKEMQRRNNLN